MGVGVCGLGFVWSFCVFVFASLAFFVWVGFVSLGFVALRRVALGCVWFCVFCCLGFVVAGFGLWF